MPSRLIGILACLLLANVVNFALNQWLEEGIPRWVQEVKVDGSTLATSLYLDNYDGTTLAGNAAQEALLDYYTYLSDGGKENYRNWQQALGAVTTVPGAFIDRALTVTEWTNTVKYLSILLLVITALLLYGNALKESNWITPLLYLGIYGGTVALYGALTSPLWTGIAVGLYVLYFVSLRLSLPIYLTEWNRMMRPGVTWCMLLLAVMAIRGPELVDYWFWTSQLFRLLLVTVGLWTVFFHLSIVNTVMVHAKLDPISRAFAFAMPLGITAVVLGLFLGLYGTRTEHALVQLNDELLLLPPATVGNFDSNMLFAIFFAGVALLVIGAIGYFIRRISR